MDDGVDVHYVIVYAGEFGIAVGSSYNTHSLEWIDKGSLKIDNGRTFGYLRESVNPLFLTLNGEDFDLRQGRVLELHNDGTVQQIKLFPSLAQARDMPSAASLRSAATKTKSREDAKTRRREERREGKKIKTAGSKPRELCLRVSGAIELSSFAFVFAASRLRGS